MRIVNKFSNAVTGFCGIAGIVPALASRGAQCPEGAEDTPQIVDMLVVQDVDARVAEVQFQAFEAATSRASCDLVHRVIS